MMHMCHYVSKLQNSIYIKDHKMMYDTVQTYTHIIPHTWEYTMDYRILKYIRTFSKSRVGRSSSHVFPCFRKGRSKHRRSSHSVWKDSPPLSVWQLESSSALLCTCMKCPRKRARFHPTKKRGWSNSNTRRRISSEQQRQSLRPICNNNLHMISFPTSLLISKPHWVNDSVPKSSNIPSLSSSNYATRTAS